MKKIFNQINETGTMLVEAMAMLGLIAMVTPILYKKAAERTTELQDINASNQLRVLSGAMDSYIKDNFTRINNGEVVKNSCNTSSVNYENFTDATTISFDLSHLCEYLPYGFLKNGKTQDTKLFTKDDPSFQVVLRRTTGKEVAEDGKEVIVAQTVTGFLTAVPNEGEDFPSTRTSRIATMIGSNGGYVEKDGKIMGAQGIWSLKDSGEIGLTLPTNTFVISSLQPISSQGLANEDVLHRKTERQNDYVLNAMETDLFMSYNSKNHNIRQVNQIIMSPQPEWMLGGDQNSFNRAIDDTPKSELSKYEADLDHTLYIGSKGGAFIEGNMAALDSLFTVRNEADGGAGEGGIKYYASKSETDTTNPSSPVTKNSRGDAVFSVTVGKMEYGNIDNKTAGALLTVDKENGSMVFESKSDSTPPGGDPAISSQKLIAANASRVNVIDGALSVRNPGIGADGGRYDEYDTNQWPEQNAAPAVIVGGGDAHKGSYTTYTYLDGKPVIAADDSFQSTDLTGEHALTVNGPAFIKDSLKTAKLKAYNVDAAKLRAGVKPADFDNVTDDRDFYLISEKKGDQNGRMLVGFNEDQAAGKAGYRLQVAEKDETLNDGTNIEAGVKLNHESGVTVRAGDVTGATNVGLITHDIAGNSTSINNTTTDGQVKIGAYDAISLATTDIGGNLIDNSVVSIQNNMLRAYTDTGLVSTGRMERYLDSVTDHARFISQGYANTGLLEDDLYSRKRGDGYLFGIGDMDFSISEVTAANAVRPVADIQAFRDDNYVTSRFSGGFAVYDHDNVQDEANYPNDASELGNASFYVTKGDFQVRATKENTDEKIVKQDIILQVDNNSDTDVIEDNNDRGSVYIRKGAMNLATNADGRLTNADIKRTYDLVTEPETAPVGYISADRFIAHTAVSPNALNASTTTLNSGGTISGTKGGAVVSYDKYEVNPAYTSVMNDIKLTTRGGARLSDILPDFVNKGIYVVDNTYRDDIVWTAGINPGKSGDMSTSGTAPSAETYTSAWLGFVPTPTCPPGYSKVITINPSGWAMAQTGTPVSRSGKIDISTHNNPYLYWYTEDGALRSNVDNAEPVQPLTFQKSNWLKAMVIPDCGGLKYDGKCNNVSEFTGWGTAMGFIYPASYYTDFVNHAAHGGGSADKGNIQNTVYWNLYPVHYKELEAYVTVYCYFRRADFDGKYVDKDYDQLKGYNNGNARKFWDKSGASNIKNLNDPALIYSDPW